MTDEQLLSVDMLSSLSPLDGLKRDNLAALARKVRVRELSPKQVLFKEGDTEKTTIYVLSGSLDIIVNGAVADTIEGGSSAARNPVWRTSTIIGCND